MSRDEGFSFGQAVEELVGKPTGVRKCVGAAELGESAD
jgi:hypothetical protein